MDAVILSGGLGTRLRPLTYVYPKSFIPLLNKPFIFYQIELLKKYDVDKIILAVNYKEKILREYFYKQKELGIEIKFVSEKKPLGTAGALRNVKRFVKGRTFILNGDILTDCNLGEFLKFHEKKSAQVSILLKEMKNSCAYGIVTIDSNSRVINFREKPATSKNEKYLINAGIYIFEPEIFSYISKENYSLEKEVFPFLIKEGIKIFGYKFDSYWLDVGQIHSYQQAKIDLLERKINL